MRKSYKEMETSVLLAEICANFGLNLLNVLIKSNNHLIHNPPVYSYETGDGTRAEEQSYLKNAGAGPDRQCRDLTHTLVRMGS